MGFGCGRETGYGIETIHDLTFEYSAADEALTATYN